MIRIDIPATSANLGSGFDSLGIALTMCNRVWMEEADELKITTTDKIKVPTDETNLIYWAARHLYQICGKTLPGLHIIQENNIPMARGLGSSSACIVAGILGANRMLGSPMSQSDLINLAAQIEGHPDNTSPAISGGLVASAMEGKRVYSVSVPVSGKISFAVMIPPFELKTEKARGVLPTEYSREDTVFNLSRSALMTASLFSGDLQNLRGAGQDPSAVSLGPHRKLRPGVPHELRAWLARHVCERRRPDHHLHDPHRGRGGVYERVRFTFTGPRHQRLACGASAYRPAGRAHHH